MRSWLNWREIEKVNIWNRLRAGDEDARREYAGDEQRIEQAFGSVDSGERQVSMMSRLREDATVLIAGGGAWTMTIPVARRVGTVYAQDSSDDRLRSLMDQAERLHLDNIVPVPGDWYALTPGDQFPICDISIARQAPCQGDILAFSGTAREYCYALWAVSPLEESGGGSGADGGAHKDKPDKRLNDFHVHFNLLYDAGADPEVQYDTVCEEFTGDSPEEIVQQMAGKGEPILDSRTLLEKVRREMEPWEGRYRYRHVQRMSLLGWNPASIHITE